MSGAGFSIGVARGDQVLLAKGYGGARPDTVYHIDSVNKNFTAAAALLLASEGKLRLDDPVTKYIPGLPPKFAAVTIRNLLNHTSGIKSNTSLPEWSADENKPMMREQIVKMIGGQPFDFAPGPSWRYNNSAFYLLGRVIEAASSQSYGEFVRSRLFAPLSMTSSSYVCSEIGHFFRNGKIVTAPAINWQSAYSAGVLCSTVGDLIRWERGLQSGRVISKLLFAMMQSPTTLTDRTKIDLRIRHAAGRVERPSATRAHGIGRRLKCHGQIFSE